MAQAPQVEAHSRVIPVAINKMTPESLKRAIQEAHRAHLQSQPSQNEPPSSVSLPEHPSKRRKTGDATPSQLQENRTGHDSSRKALASSVETIWHMDGNMRAEYVSHNPNAMFPEPSSTVPNATLTQQRVLEVVNAPAMLGQDSEAEPPRYLLPPEASMPFSDMLKLSPADPLDCLESSNHTQVAPDPRSTDELHHEKDLHDQSKRGSYAHPDGDLMSAGGIQVKHFVASPSQRMAKESRITANAFMMLSAPSSAKSKESSCVQTKQVSTLISEDDELAAIELPKEQYKPRPSRSRSHKVDMDQAIDYSAKPERAKKTNKRRSTTSGTMNSVEVTTPQKVKQICDMGFTPSSTKRALTQNNGDVTQTVDWLVSNGIGEDELAPKYTPRRPASKVHDQELPMDPDTIKVIMRDLNTYRRDDPGATQSITEAATATEFVTQPQMVDEKLQQPTREVNPGASPTKSPKVRVIIASRSPNVIQSKASVTAESSKKKAKRRKTTLDEPEPEPEPLKTTPTTTEFITEKKRGRGRPKKTVKTSVPTEIVQEDAPEEPAQNKQREQQNQVLEAIDPNVASGRFIEDSIGNAIDAQLPETIDYDADARTSTPAAIQLSEVTFTRTSERSAKPANRSPKNKDKVPYRVGLSKRARIAPLLRTLKK